MYSFNDQYWPVVTFEFAGLQTLAEHEQSLKLWDKCFKRKESFVVVRLFKDEDALIHPEGAAKSTKSWLRDGADQSIKNSVVAMINIVPESAYERMKHMSVEAVFGVPGGIFKNREDAMAWLNASLGSTVNI